MNQLSQNVAEVALERERVRVVQELGQRSVVLTAPTGSGKSTRVPLWFAGRVLVIEPRRVACQALARRVSELLGSALGEEVGYRVRHDERLGAQTRIVFATPGIVLQDPAWLDAFNVVILDEFHERRLDTDWICAWLRHTGRTFVVMSATILGERVAQYLGGCHVTVETRAFSVDVTHLAESRALPDPDLTQRLLPAAVKRAQAQAGDVLCFLPGKGEIRQAAARLRQLDFEVYELHGGLSLEQQALVFQRTRSRKLILATNVAETSLTLPEVRTVIDSGLVKRTHYHGGRAYLSLACIAEDSALQRQGRAGRTAPGKCLRLWGSDVRLQSVTPPEVHREALTQLLLWSAANGVGLGALTLLDAPKEQALASAREELLALGAIDSAGSVTQRGLRLHRIPIDPWYGRLLVEAEARGCLAAMIELVACLSNNPPVPLPEVDPMRERPPCDASALLEWYRTPSKVKGIHAEVKSTVARLRRMFDVKDSGQPAEVSHLLQTVIAADPRAAHIPRMRKQRVSWASGGTELELGRESCAAQAHSPQAIVVLGTRAIGSGRKRKLLATRASAIPLNWLVAAGLGTVRVSAARIERRKLVARLERIYAGKVIHSVEGPVVGDAARQGAARLYLEGRWFAGALRRSRERVMRNQLAATLAATPGYEYLRLSTAAAPPNLEQWIVERLAELGLDSGDDLDLISEQDLLFPDVPAEVAPLLDSEFPLRVDLGDCTYAVNYDLAHRQVLLQIVKGRRNTPPPLSFLPKFRGFRVCVEVAGGIRVLRERR